MELKQGELENIILNALWALEEKNNNNKTDVKEIQEYIKTDSKNWAYTTVKTVLDRLVDKEIILRIKEGKKYFYSTLISRQNAGEEALKKVLKQYFRNNFDEMTHSIEQLKVIDFNKELIIIG